jgi:hypothetical protein
MQSGDCEIHHVLPLHRQVNLIWKRYKSVAAILHSGKDKAPAATPDAPILFHPNIRGRDYYN